MFAAASLHALDTINAQWQKETGKKAIISYAATTCAIGVEYAEGIAQ